MASMKPFFLSIFFFFVQFMSFSFGADPTTTKANPKPPVKTAPITKIKNEKAARASFSENSAHAVTEYAGVIWESFQIVKAQGMLNTWRPYVAKSDGLTSFCQVKVAYEDFSSQQVYESVEAGWRVNGNGGKPRFYVYSLNKKSKQGCLNLDCGEFKLAEGAPNRIDTIFEPTSTYGGHGYYINVTISFEHRDNIAVWAVYLLERLVGYYPASLFDKMAKFSNRVDFGGGVTYMSNGPGTPHSGTEMGSGHFSGEGSKKAAYIKLMQVYDPSGPISDRYVTVQENVSNRKCYDLYQGRGKDWYSYIYYGGPGGKASGCTNTM